MLLQFLNVDVTHNMSHDHKAANHTHSVPFPPAEINNDIRKDQEALYFIQKSRFAFRPGK